MIMKTLSDYVKSEQMGENKSYEVIRMIPKFLYESAESVGQILLRLSQLGLTGLEIR